MPTIAQSERLYSPALTETITLKRARGRKLEQETLTLGKKLA